MYNEGLEIKQADLLAASARDMLRSIPCQRAICPDAGECRPDRT